MANAARQRSDDLRAQAAALLASIDDLLLAELGIDAPPEPGGGLADRTFRVPAGDLMGWRFDPHALHPDVRACRDAIAASPGGYARLHDAAAFVRRQASGRTLPLPYVGLENVESGVGLLINADEEASFGTAFRFEPGQVLFPKLRPYLNKVHLADRAGYCSTEFHVFQPRHLHPRFLALALRSRLTVRQTRHLMTGSTLPRLQTRDVAALLVPTADAATQGRIVAAAAEAEAASLTAQADAELAAARAKIEAMLLGEDA